MIGSIGQGVEPDDARALTWYQLAADQGNIHGKRNLEDFTFDLQERGGGAWQTATAGVNDAAIARAQRWAKIDDLQRRIAGLEGDAQNQDDLADQLEHTGKGKNDALTKIFNAVGSVPATKYHIEAEKYRAEAARLRAELAQIENQSTAASVSGSLASFTLGCRDAVSYFPDTAGQTIYEIFPYDGQPFHNPVGEGLPNTQE
jgi:TPR repeat protein